jgi:hypothetical protein
MADFSTDPIINAIQNGIKEDIRVAFEHERFRAGIILIYAGMDAMAFLDMPVGQTEVRKDDFIRWAETYIRFPCKEQVTGKDFYGARCAMLHAYGAVSRMSKAGECRMLGYMDRSIPEVRFNPAVSTDVVLVSTLALKDAFFSGIDRFLVHAFSNPDKIKCAEHRLQNFTLLFDRRQESDMR